MQLQAGVQTYS